jgi:hypothetical protein
MPQSTSAFLLVISLPSVTERYIARSSHLAISSVACLVVNLGSLHSTHYYRLPT